MNKTESVAVAFSPEDNKTQIILPLNAAIKIFTYLTRDEIEICKQVCSGWKQLVEFADKQLPKRPIDAVVLSSNHEYTISIYYKDVRRVYCFRKYFYDRDIDEIELKRVTKLPQLFDEHNYRFPCGESFPCVYDHFNFGLFDHMHDLECRKRINFMMYHRRNNYSRKLFTPPLGFYERLKTMLHNGYVKRLVFQSFTFTDLFVEKFFEYVKGPFKHLDVVYLHFCSLRRINSDSFHNLLDQLSPKKYFIDKLTNCLPVHVSKPLLDKHSIKMAEVFSFGSAFARNHQLQDNLFLIDDDTFLNFINTLSAYPNVSRKFFGISQCRITQEFIQKYVKLVAQIKRNNLVDNQLVHQNKNFWLFKHVVFGNLNYKKIYFGKMDEYGIEELYNGVINDVINQVRLAFVDDGVDIEILRHLKKAWEERLQTANESSGCSASESKSQTGTEISQLDGGGPTMDDSSSEEEEVKEDESTEAKERLKETDANKSSGDEEPPLNSDDDGEDENAETIFETDNIVLCQFDKIVRTRKMWKFHLKEGIMTIRGKEFCFRRCNGDAEW